MTDFDTSDLNAFIARAESAISGTEREIEQVISKGALNIKSQLQREMSASKHFSRVAAAISYDIKTVGAFGGGAIEAEIGPDKDGAGPLANVAYFGTPRGGGTVADPRVALVAEVPNVERFLLDKMGRVFD